MRKNVLLLLLFTVCLLGKAQNNLPYKPFSEFNNDTTAFVVYNCLDRADDYKGKTMKELIKDLELPIIICEYFTSIKSNKILGVLLSVSKGEPGRRIQIYWDKYDNSADKKIKDIRNKKFNYWSKDIYRIIKDFRIKEIRLPYCRNNPSDGEDEFVLHLNGDKLW